MRNHIVRPFQTTTHTRSKSSSLNECHSVLGSMYSEETMWMHDAELDYDKFEEKVST